MSDVTRLIEAAQAGDDKAAADLLPLIYDELRKLAAARMTAEAPGHSLDATALVHEAYLRLMGDQQFDGCGHFFAAAAEAMRRILIESARRQASLKRGGGLVRRNLVESELIAPESSDEVLAVDEALVQLASVDARRPSWSNFGILSASPRKKPPTRWGCPFAPPNELGPMPGLGSLKN